MLGKYYSIFLIGAFVAAIMLHPARWTYLRSPSPWISAIAGLIVLAPHLLWLRTAELTPFEYAYLAHRGATLDGIIVSIGTYLLGGLAYVALPIAVYAIAVRPDRRLLAQTFWPSDPDRRMVVVLLAAQLLLPALSAPFVGIELSSLWTMQSWFLLPIVLLAPANALVPRSRAVTVAAAVLAVTVLALLAAPVAAWTKHKSGAKHGQEYYRQLSEEVTQEWRRHTQRPLTIVAGDIGIVGAVTFYSPDHPDSVPDFDLKATPWVTQDRLRREGYAVVCDNPGCMATAGRWTPSAPQAIRREIDLSRRYLGQQGNTARFFIAIVPPAPPTDAGDAPR